LNILQLYHKNVNRVQAQNNIENNIIFPLQKWKYNSTPINLECLYNQYKHILVKVKMSEQPITSSMSTMTLVHMATEILAVIGLTYWIHSKTKDLQTQITELKEKLVRCEEIIQKQSEMIEGQGVAISNIVNFLQGTASGQKTTNQRHSKQQNTTKGFAQQRPKPMTKQPQRDQRTNIREALSNADDSGSDMNEEEMDQLLASEIDDLECEDGQCRLPDDDEEAELVMSPVLATSNPHSKKK
jgi:hypothetical protein